MQTRMAVAKQPEPSSAAKSSSVQASQAKKTAQKEPVKTRAELKQLTDRVLANPENVSREEYALLIKTIGYQGTQMLLAQSKQQKQPDKKEQLKELERSVQEDDKKKEQEQEKPETAGQKQDAAPPEAASGGMSEQAPLGNAPEAEQSKGMAAVGQMEPSNAEQPKKEMAEDKAASSKGLQKSVKALAPALQVKPQPAAAEKASTEPKAAAQNQRAAVEHKAALEHKAEPKAVAEPRAAAEHKAAAKPAPASERAAEQAPEQVPHAAQAEEAAGAAAEARSQPAPQTGADPAATAKSAKPGGSAAEASGLVPEAKGKEPPKPKAIAIKADSPDAILQQLGTMPPTDMVNAFSSAVSVSKGALDKQRQKTQAVLPSVPTPTGLPAGNSAGQSFSAKVAAAIQARTQPKGMDRFQSQKQGGAVQTGQLRDFPTGSQAEEDPDQIMEQARGYAANPPGISMTGEADPSQADGFQSEATRHVEAAKQTELNQTKQDFGENQIQPKADPTVLRADKAIRAVTPPAFAMKRAAALPPEVADRINPSLTSTLSSFMADRKGEYQKGKEPFEAGVESAKNDTSSQINTLKTEAAQNQRTEQEAAKSEVKGLRGQWQSEINQSTGEFDRESKAAAVEKKRDIDGIRRDKEGEVKATLSQAQKDANKEYTSTKKEADKKQKDADGGEKKDRNIFQKAWDWTKEKAQQALDGLKKAVNFLFTQLRKAVKSIFDKAKALAVGIIEKGRQLIVKAIQGLGTVLKGLVNKVFARFPGIAKKITGLIDKTVNKAVQAVNKVAAALKKGVTAALNFMAKSLDTLFAGVQALYNKVLNGISKFLNGDFKAIFGKLLEGAQIAAEIALAFATGGGSVLLQIIKWLATTLPQLIRQAGSVFSFVTTLRSMKVQDVKQLLSPAGMGGYLVKGLFGELKSLPAAKEEEDKEKEASAGGKEEKGLMKVLQLLKGVFKVLKGTYGKVAGAINKALPGMNISTKSWFNPFAMIYAGAVQAMEVVKNPAEALNEGAGKLKSAAGSFFSGIKGKVTETAGSIKEKVMLLGKPAQLMKLLANKAVDMVLNFIVTHPPSALIKAVFKGIEAAAGSSIVELVRKHIPFADKLINKVAESSPVQSLMKPLEQPVNKVGGLIDQVTEEASGLVDDAEKQTGSVLGNGTQLLAGLAGVGAASGKDGAGKSNKAGAGSGGKKGDAKGGGDFVGTVKGGIHTRLITFGKNLLKSGKELALKGAEKIKGAVSGLMVRFSIGSESHKLWVEKKGSRNVVMMASNEEELWKKIKGFWIKVENIEDEENKKMIKEKLEKLESIISNLESEKDGKLGDAELKTAAQLVTDIYTNLKDVDETKKPAFVISRAQYPNHARMLDNAQKKGHSLKNLQKGSGPNEADRNRYHAQKEIRKLKGPPPDGFDYDEFPYASTKQGGAGAHVEPVQSEENQAAGRALGAFYRAHKMKELDAFDVQIK
ncbi:NucA/NucB deoxyribonuclease domain-containing protein [Paenibacillus mesotrionivorans]|uniref:NucA/NucB deoxyribonuclease domain-containing protein n=1 Tax=Paenibacillus mesotrionivorans TaxID=3160968 RepID=A0ACC7NVV9_9BACL